ncbi:hypothetical protein NMY22_g11785 [Coprinellus aureogranulatus]|nr:hypothetical protein NMY22_g11785 [Coprinellus aureogranulatus]
MPAPRSHVSPALSSARPLNVNDLSDDIFGIIFDFLRHAHRDGRWRNWSGEDACVPVVVCAVCRRWRGAARAHAGMWSQISIRVATKQLCDNPQVLWIHNQAEVDLRTEFSGPLPITLAFIPCSTRPNSDSECANLPTPFKFFLDNTLSRVHSVLLDLSCARLLSRINRYSFPSMTQIHIGDSNNFCDLTAGSMHEARVQHFVGALFWRSQTGVKEVVWSAERHRILEASLDWGTLTVLRIPNRMVELLEQDLLMLLKECSSLHTLDSNASLVQYYTGNETPTAITGPRPETVENDALRVLHLKQRCQTRKGRKSEKRCLPGVVLPNIENIRVDHSSSANLYHLHFLTNLLTVSSVKVLQLIAGMVGLQDLIAILIAMPSLENFTLTAGAYQWGQPNYWQVYLGIDDSVLDAVGTHSPGLRSFTVFGESWLTVSAVSLFSTCLLYTHTWDHRIPDGILPLYSVALFLSQGAIYRNLGRAVRGGSRESAGIKQAAWRHRSMRSCSVLPVQPTFPPSDAQIVRLQPDGDPSIFFATIIYPELEQALLWRAPDQSNCPPPRVCEHCKAQHIARKVT